MSESEGFTSYIHYNFCFSCVIDLLLEKEGFFDLLQSMSATFVACAADTSFPALIFSEWTIDHQIKIRPI